MRWLAAAGRGLEQAIVPNSCVFCGARLPLRQLAVCRGCEHDLPGLDASFELAPFTFAAAPFDYAFPVDAAIKAMKFRRKLFYAPVFAGLIQPALQRLPDDVDAILPVPLHWRRQMRRGFNQAAEIAAPISRRLGLRVVRSVIRNRATPYQSGLAAAHRRRNLKDAFSLRAELHAQHVLIVDDVITTGATCVELASQLLQAGVERVSVLAVARTGQH